MPSTEWIRALPKAQLHVHVEGSLPPSLMTSDATAAAGDLGAFLQQLDVACSKVETADQLADIAEHMATTAAHDGVVHTEAILNPTHWRAFDGRLEALVDGLDRGFTAAERRGLPTTRLNLSIKRTQSSDDAVALVEWIIAAQHPRVCGLSIDGNEATAGRTGPRFAPAFRLAAEHGVRRCVHAGESSGPEGVLDALELLWAERIDHGVRAIADPTLVARLAEQRVPLDVCPTSNIILGVFDAIERHPVADLVDAGVPVTINTDDPALFGCTVVSEYQTCAHAFGWGREQLARIARTSIEASFAPAHEQAAYLAQLDRFLLADKA